MATWFDEGFEGLRTAMEVHPSLRTVWAFGVDRFGPEFSLEFVALANHRKAVGEEIVWSAERFRQLQFDGIAAILHDRGIFPEVCPPVVVLLATNGVSQAISSEDALGITSGHDEMLRFVERWVDEAERDFLTSPGSSGLSGRMSVN